MTPLGSFLAALGVGLLAGYLAAALWTLLPDPDEDDDG